jgi:DNA processing protein
MVSESVAILQLLQTKGFGPRSLDRVLTVLGHEEHTLQEFIELDPDEIASKYALKKDLVESIPDSRQPALELAEQLEERGIRVVSRLHESYPRRLVKILGDKAPPVMFMAGNDQLLAKQAAGFCGARDASEEGLRCAAQASRALARHGVVVVSGHAQGVDVTTHGASLEAGGTTVFVLPEGILHFRPRSGLRNLLSQDNNLVISEFPPRLPWSVANAMQRNRTICALVDALIVVEAGQTGGTFAAAESALALGVPLFVLEFPQPASSALGNAILLQKGGIPLPCLPDREPDLTNLLRAMHLDKPARVRDANQPGLFDHLE